MTKISQGTLLPLGFAIAMIGGGSGWATRQELNVARNTERIAVTFSKFDEIEKKLFEISERLGRIEGHLERGKK